MSKAGSDDWQQVKELFTAALQQTGAARGEFLERACGGNSLLRREVESLLRSYESAESFMETPAVEAVAKTLLEESKSLTPGTRVGPYEIVSAIGEGGMGEVYLARDTRLGRRVAMKLLPQYFVTDKERMRRFKQEARLASTLSHPNVCVIHEVGETADGQPFITMEYVEGVTLRQRLGEQPLTLAEALDIAVQIADALVAAHESGIVHRDIKPENIMLRPDGYVKVLDFGLAKLTEQVFGTDALNATTLMRTSVPGMVMGTVAYMSPEQARGVPVDLRTDIWSLGVVLYEMITGRAPFEGETPTDVVVGIVEREAPPVADFLPQLPSELERIIRKTLRKNREERYQLSRELSLDLRSLRRELQVEVELGRSAPPNREGSGPAEMRRLTREADASRLTNIAAPATGNLARWVLLALIAFVGIAAIAYAAYRIFPRSAPSGPSQRFVRYEVTKLTTNGNAVNAAISRDGKYVAYVMSEAGGQSLWLRQAAVDTNVRLAPVREGRYLGVAFAPDGNFIFFGYLGPEENARPELYKVPVLGLGAAALRVTIYDGPAVLSHDGKRIAFYRYDEAARNDVLMVANADGSSAYPLATRTWPERFGWDWDSRPSWSTDDQMLTCAIIDANVSTFFVKLYDFRVADKSVSVVPLTAQRFELLNHVSVLDDASGVIVSAKAQGASFYQLWHVSRDGGARQITHDLSDYLDLSLTADSRAIVTIQKQLFSNIYTSPSSNATDFHQVTAGVGRYFDVRWAPEGRIMYASDASGNANIFEIESDSAAPNILTDVGRNYAPAISRDNSYITYHSNRAGNFQIWRANRDGTNPMQLTSSDSESHWPEFSPDGKWIVYEHFENESNVSIWKVSAGGGSPVPYVKEACIRPTYSPDGKWLGLWCQAKERQEWELAVAAAGTGEIAKRFKVPKTVIVSFDTPVHWLPDSSSLSFIDRRGNFDNIWAQPIDGSAARKLTEFTDSLIFAFDWSRDGRLMLSRGVSTNDVILLRETK